MHATSHTQPTRNAEDRTTSTRRWRLAWSVATFFASASLFILPAAIEAQQRLVLSTRTVEVDESGADVASAYGVHLSTKPKGNVTVEVTSSGSDIAGVDKEVLVFTPNDWSSSKSITVTGKGDRVDNTGGGRIVTITNKADGRYGTAVVYVTVKNNDDSAALLINPSNTSDTPISVTESGNEPGDTGIGNEASYTVKLGTKPEGDVTVAVASKDTRIATASPSSLTFTVSNWETEQPITITGVDNDSGSPDEERPVDITNTPSGGGYDSVEQVTVKVNVKDVGRDDVIGVTFEPREVKVKEGGTATYSMRLNTNPGRSVTVTFQDAPRSTITLGPPSLTFTSSNWKDPQTVTVTSLPDSRVAEIIVNIDHDIKNYAGLTESLPRVTVTVIDDDTAGVTISPSSRSVRVPENGGEIDYTMVLDSEPAEIVTVTVASRDDSIATVRPGLLMFTTSNWNSSQTVTVTGVDDMEDNPGGSRLTTIANEVSSSDSNYGAAELEEPSVSVAVTNVGDTAGLEFSGFNSNTPDTGTIRYDLNLKTVPAGVGATLTLTTSDPAVSADHDLTGPITDTTPVTVTVTVDDDVENHRESRKVTITHKLSGGGYDAISAVKTITVSDSEKREGDELGFNIPETLSVDEAISSTSGHGRNHYTVKLDPPLSAGATDVTVTVTTGSEHIRISDIKSDGLPVTVSIDLLFSVSEQSHTVYVYGVNDDVDNGNNGRTATIKHTASDYVPKEVKVTVRNRDDRAALTLTETSIDIDENEGTTTYVVGIGSAPESNLPVKVYVISSDPDTAKVTTPSDMNADNNLELSFSGATREYTITVTGMDDNIDNGRSRTGYITHTPGGSGNYDSVSPKTLTVKVSNDDEAGLEVGGDSFDITEGGELSYTVRPKTEPMLGEAITVRIAGQNAGVATARPAELKFTSANWMMEKTIKVTAVGAGSTKITNAPSGGGYGSAQKKDVAVTVSEVKTKGLRVDPSEVTVGEGATRTYTVRLRDAPDGSVTVGIASSNTSIATVSPAELKFTIGNWKTPQTVTVTGVPDSKVNSGGRSAAITHTASGGGYDNVPGVAVSVTVTDDDATVEVSSSSVEVAEARGTARYTVKLAVQPTETVTVAVASSNTSIATVSPGSLTFTTSNWNSPQTVTVTGVDDRTPGGNRSATITHSASGGGYDETAVQSVNVTVTDDDGMTVAPTAVEVAEAGGTGTYRVSLNTQPTGTVTVAVASSDTRIATVNSTSLTFTPSNWASQTVTVTGVDDQVDNGTSRSATITNTPSGAGYSSPATVRVTVTDDEDAPTLAISGGEATEGNTGMRTPLRFTVTRRGATDQEVTVSYADADTGTATAGTDYSAVAAGALTFAPNEMSKPITVTVTGDDESEKDETVVITLSNPSNATVAEGDRTATGTIIDDDASRLSIAAAAATVEEGGTLIFTVTLDPPIDDQQVTVDLAPGGTARPIQDYTYTGVSETGMLTFAAGEASKTIAVTVVDDTDYELNETIEVELRNPRPTGSVEIETGRAMAMATIMDNDPKPMLSISGTSVAEGNDGTTSKLTFKVTKSGGTSMEATVVYADAGTGTATAGTDYISVEPGTLTFAPDETTKTVTVTVKGDDKSERDETVVIALSRPAKATIAEGKGTATGTIIDDDTLPRVASDWLARFGRTAAGATLDAIARRMNDAAGPSITVAGHRAALAPAPVARVAGGTAEPWEEGRFRALTIEELANDSSFDAGDSFVEGLNVWGASSYNQFEMTPQGTYTMDGSLVSAILGVDHQGDTHVAGLALAYHGGAGDFGGIGGTAGSLGTNLYSVHPYARLTLGEAFHVGGSFGIGTGDLRITDKGDTALVETGVGMPILVALDARMELVPIEDWVLAVQTDGHYVQMVADERSPRFARVETNTHRLRLGLENSFTFLVADGVSLAPVLKTGLRYDGGDATEETGFGFDVGGGLRLDAAVVGLMVDARGHASLSNWGEEREQAPALRDWGVGGVIRWRPAGDGMGPEMSLAPAYGGTLASAAAPSLNAEIGYRMAAFGGVLTPYSAVEFSVAGQQSYRAGAHFEFGQGSALSVEGTHRQSTSGVVEQFLTLEMRLRQ